MPAPPITGIDSPAPRWGKGAVILLLLPLLTAAAQPDVAAQRARLAALSTRERELAERIGSNRTTLLRLLSALEMWRRDPPPALLVSPQRARDAARAAILMRAITPELRRRADALSAQARELAGVRRQAAEAGAALFAQESAAADRGHAGPALDQALLSPAERTRMAQARGDPLSLGLADPREISASPPALEAPVPGPPIRRFGDAWPGRGRSEGWSWAPRPNAPVLAPADGEVEYAGPLRSWKLVAILRLKGGWRVVLAGLQAETAPVGALVHAGDAIGQSPPAATPPPELYLELRRGAEPVDPEAMLAAVARR